MRWGVTYSALLANGVVTMEIFLVTRNLLTLLLAAPIHGVCALLCARDPRFFDLALLWGRTRIPALLANARFWKSSSYSPLRLDFPDRHGRRRTSPELLSLEKPMARRR
jgi:type IV secretion system protein VirB3